MSDESDWAFSGPDDAKAEIRAAVRYLVKDATGSDRGDIVRQIIAIVGEAARGLPPGDRADLLVGRFFRYFGAIELELNVAIRKLFELSPESAETICANLEFFKKLNIVRSALIDQNKDGSKQSEIDKLFRRIASVNNERKVAAHACFEANGDDGVVFSRAVAEKGLKRTSLTWTENRCSTMFTEMEAIRKDLHILAQSIAPYHPSLDFSDPRNSMYLGGGFFW
jgi:hypothetical protein